MPVTTFHLRPFARKFPAVVPRCYVMGKVMTDPLYAAVLDVLRPTREPLLDVGCGMGVLAFYLREHGWEPPCLSVDVDGAKIALARRIQHQWPGANEFRSLDAVAGLPEHSGSVTLLDVLQYLRHDAQKSVLTDAAARVCDDGVLVIRNAMAGDGGRHGITKATDWMARWCRWMGVTPKDYPKPGDICDVLVTEGLHGEFRPLWGRTPFHNWLGVFRRRR